mmetsp:Transcript_32159/g.46737  ORF Transcript_32159/g.46737 Transcript_32159/m.46737 type:complete len:246 (-) Transcript_32159:90-827(-)|eukprot:CAMPEP_0116013914 /NCGR_PEP_ID=MMETSP0321-20121206/5991_1 /TAXON_ID=163516 /ORGANISM="Leptocylindrus danicus var. danicus, Strain B650" /LENGTH=245 /DNA_ID=CAMNT_0003483517 /DNA_START=181 /DNA_END=918 /DNA_ORIENTATION=-
MATIRTIVLTLLWSQADALAPGHRSQASSTKLNLKHEHASSQFTEENEPSKLPRCPSDTSNSNDDMDRREALFAMIGSLWSVGLMSDAIFPQEAQAVYGSDANIQLPDMIGGMTDRVNKQCIVESLGNRECLVYADPDKAVYKGLDAVVLLERVDVSSRALATIPDLAESRKWSKIIGVLTGPMGTLVSTMNQLAVDRSDVIEAAKRVKDDIIAIGQAAERKDQGKVLAYHKLATEDLVKFGELI